MRVAELRSCYETDCLFWEGQDPPGRIRWFFVDETTPFLPFGSVFFPSAWEDEPEGALPVGEIPGAPRDYATGAPPYPVAGTGPPCGSADDFAGLAAPPPFPPALNLYGGLLCCPLPDPPFVHVACPFAPGGAWSDYTAVTVGGDPLSAWAPLLGSFRLSAEAPCEYETRPLQYNGTAFSRWTFFIVSLPGEGLAFRLELLAGPVFVWRGLEPLAWDPLRAVEVPVAVSSPPGGPLSVWVIPGLPAVEGNSCVILGHPLPTNVVVRFPDPGIGLFWSPSVADVPFAQNSPCSWVGRVWWQGIRLAGLPRLRAFRQSGLGVLPDTRIVLLLVAPDTSSYLYASEPGGWDGFTPLSLVREPGFTLLSLPDRLTVFHPDFPP